MVVISTGPMPRPVWLICLALAGLLPAVDVAVAIVNRRVMRDIGTNVLPGLALRNGIPVSLRTVPVLLTTAGTLAEQIERLEIHHLASPEGELYYALLSDWTDSPKEHVDGDEALLCAAATGIGRLNRKYPDGGGNPRFLLLHRRRMWNSEEASGWAGSASAASFTS